MAAECSVQNSPCRSSEMRSNTSRRQGGLSSIPDLRSCAVLTNYKGRLAQSSTNQICMFTMRKSILTSLGKSSTTRLTIEQIGSPRLALSSIMRTEGMEMRTNATDDAAQWTRHAGELQGPGFAKFQRELTRYNAARFRAQLPDEAADDLLEREAIWARAEIEFVEAVRHAVAPLMTNVP